MNPEPKHAAAAPAAQSAGIRPVVKVIHGQPTSDGAGVRLTRIVGTQALSELDPFLLLDAFHSADPTAYIAGFPDHPHRGFETITYMLAGRMRHRDNKGNSGLLGPGGVQWMTAGRGIVHSEMPEQQDGLMSGFQLWLNLPASEKMSRPKYRDLQGERLTETETEDGARIRVIAGEAAAGRLVGPVEGLAVAPKFVDVRLPPGTTFREVVPRGHTAFAYLDDGEVRFGPEQTPARAPALVIFADGDTVEASAGPGGGRFLLAAARPLGEPIARHGPFVMNTRAEIEQALQDLRTGHFIRDEPRGD
jgi:redox-sensitive bicupin YhaK (pirin superfamily)